MEYNSLLKETERLKALEMKNKEHSHELQSQVDVMRKVFDSLIKDSVEKNFPDDEKS